MSTLQFPTQAEQAVAAFNAKTKTVAFITIAKRMGVEIEKGFGKTIYRFDDDTSVEVTGRGKAHKMETFLP